MPRDAEAWLAERGIEREPLRITPPEGPPADRSSQPDARDAKDGEASEREAAAAPAGGGPAVSTEQAVHLAEQAAADASLRAADAAATPDPQERSLGDDVAAAVAFVRRSTGTAPQAEGRLRDKLAERGWTSGVIDRAMERARAERLVDDDAMAAAFVAERRAKGHAVARIRRDLRARGFGDDVLGRALADAQTEDPEAAAFALASRRAEALAGVSAEAAFRRIVGHLVRRGYGEGLARKVAREAVFTSRDPERTVGR